MELMVSTDPDTAAWDAFVSSASSGHFMQSFGWASLQRQSGWDPHFLQWSTDGEIRAAALLLSRRVPLAGRVFYAPRGPVINYADTDAVSAVEAGLAKYVSKHGGIAVRVEPYLRETPDATGRALPGAVAVPRDWSYWNAPKLVLWLDLRRDEDAVFRGMSSSSRAQVRRGYKAGVEFTLGDTGDLDEFYRLMTLTGQHKGIAVHDAEYYRRLFAHVNQSAQVQLFLGRFAGEVVTTGVSVRYGKKAWLLYAASSPQHYNLRVNRTLQWEMIKWAHAAGCERYDFRGTACSDPPSKTDPGFGVYEFKNSFGPEYVRLVGYYDFVARPAMYKLMRLAEERLLPAAYRMRTWLPHGRTSTKK